MPDGRDLSPEVPRVDEGVLLDPHDPLAHQNEKLRRICEASMRRIEQPGDNRGAAYGQFQRAVLLENQVRERTRDLERALDLNESNSRLAAASRETERARSDLAGAIEAIGDGFALFDPDDRLVMCTSRFGLNLPDLRDDLRPGLPFADYVRLVSLSTHLDRPPDVSSEAWARARMERHGEAHVALNVRMSGERMIQVSEHRMADGQTVIMQTDVSDIVRAEREEQEKLRDDQARLIRATLEHLGQGVCIVAPDGTVAAYNRRLAALLEIPLARLAPRAGPASFEVVLAHLCCIPGTSSGNCDLRAWRARPAPHAPFRADLQGGGGRWLDVFAAEAPDGGFVLSVTDVSAERASARALHEANELLEARVASHARPRGRLGERRARQRLAHALRGGRVPRPPPAPLGRQALPRLHRGRGRSRPSARDLGQGAERARQRPGHHRGASRHLPAGARAGCRGRPAVDLGAILAQLRAEFAPAAALKGLRLKLRALPVRVSTDPAYLRRILQNLLANAVR